MKIIGITGGVGAGKTEVLKLIAGMCDCVIVTADRLARSLEQKGEVCYEPLVELLGKEVLGDDKEIDAAKMSKMIFADGAEDILAAVNGIVHPAVKRRILEMIDEEAKKGTEYFFIEAALLIEDHYDTIVDEMWYIYADEDIRRKRLKDSRGYSDSKIDEIFASQNSDETFRRYCSAVIDNSGSIEDTKIQLAELFDVR
ncbi:MAG: dephospho-CoA kinase [Lachnospiraceae bacterium]|nr:dephospho-CoA kinase [Lachnospiraceae bacterium]